MAERQRHYFRAIDPTEVRASQDAYDTERKAFFERVEAFAAELTDGRGKLEVMGDGWGMWADHLVDAETGRAFEPIPEGWHFYKTKGEVKPYRGGKTKADKAAVEAFAELNKTSPGDMRRWLATEFDLTADWMFRGFGVQPVGDDIFLIYGDGQLGKFEWDGNKHFEPVKASTYHLAVEAAEEAS